MNESIIKNLTHFEIETRDMVLKPVSICTSVSNLVVVADQDSLPSWLVVENNDSKVSAQRYLFETRANAFL